MLPENRAMTSKDLYEVVVATKLDKPLIYSGDDLPNTANPLRPGALVRVPLGQREVTGAIIRLLKKPLVDSELEELSAAPLKLKSIASVFDASLWLTTELLDSITWAASYYHQSLARVLSAALPAALIKNKTNALQPAAIWSTATMETGQDLSNTLKSLNRSPRQQALFKWLHAHPGRTLKDIDEAGFDTALLRKLKKRKLVLTIDKNPNTRAGFSSDSVDTGDTGDTGDTNDQTLLRSSPPTPTKEQEQVALDLQNDRKNTSADCRPRLLEGVTGSGKTEVYLQAANIALAEKGQVLILVPEIGLIPQLKQSIEARFSTTVATYSSDSSDGERLKCWQHSRSGQPMLVVGTRSSIFLPFKNLQLIIVDEEHDLSYKQQEGFRYNARDLAVVRARALKIPSVLGSATPSIESLRNSAQGNYRHSQMHTRVTGLALPKINVIEKPANQNQIISNTSLARIREELDKHSQVMVFINRRGYAPRLSCTQCGWLARCDGCNMAFCKHIHPPQLICHHCDARTAIPIRCPECHSTQLEELGAGTEQIEHILTQIFPKHLCIRVDRDSTSTKGGLQKRLAPAVAGQSCILVGTQMLAKGHHLPKLTLAVILNADQALFSHDFRAMEHLSQLVTQVAGRTGRAPILGQHSSAKSQHGELILETTFPEHPALVSLAQLPYTQYISQLINERRERGLPPFAHGAILRAEHHDLNTLIHFMHHAATIANTDKPPSVEILGPLPASIEKRKAQFRYQIDLRATERRDLHFCLHRLSTQLKALRKFSRIRWDLDIDPLTLD